MSAEVSNGYIGYVDPDFPNPGTDGDSRIINYGYTPSKALAILGIILFALSFVLHLILLFRHRATLYFSIPVLFGTAFEIVGYVFRLLSATISPYRVSYFVVQYFFIVVAPVFFSASIYGVLSSLLRRLGPGYSPVLGPKTILAVFVTADVVSTVVQIAGAAMIGVAESNRRDPTTANNILLAGLAVQVASFAVFLALLLVWVVKARDWIMGDVDISAGKEKGRTGRRRRWMVVGFVVASLLVYLRTTFRLAETAEGLFSQLQTREAFFGCLEFMPIVLAVWMLGVVHPGRWANEKRT